jgi:cytochrome c biogenesis factor
MFSPDTVAASIGAALDALATLGRVLDVVVLAAAAVTVVAAVTPAVRRWLPPMLVALTASLGVGAVALGWFHLRLWQLTTVVDPQTGAVTGSVAVPPWIESGKLYVWALILGIITAALRRHRAELQPLLAAATAVLASGAILWEHPFTDPVPGFLAQYAGYLSAWASGDASAAIAAFRSMEGSRLYYYNTWYMWAHPPLLFFSYGTFVASFAAAVLMIVKRRSSYEQTAYRWARLGYLPLTFGMLIGFPWAILAWQGDSWWWSGKVNMSIMMWLLYTAYLHGRLYLRRRGMWRVVAALAVLSFVALVLTYVTTYLVPGAHSVI